MAGDCRVALRAPGNDEGIHMRTHKIAALGGDGIGPEVVEAGLEVLAVCAELRPSVDISVT